MDGNGRWAEARGLSRIRGHQAGVHSIRATIRAAIKRKIEFLTLYAFSVDNWKRPRGEVDLLMHLLEKYLKEEREGLVHHGIRFRAIGRISGLPVKIRREIRRCEKETRDGRRLTLVLALNYGGQEEIVDAARRLAARCARGKLRPKEITRELFAASLYTGAAIPPPDLLIRTAGEMRISNFLLWQLSYAEIWVTDVCWPEFRREHLAAALRDYARRKRKFGGLPEIV